MAGRSLVSIGMTTLSSPGDRTAANGGGHCPGEAKVRITIDLTTAARRHLAFLKSLSDSTYLHHAPTILRSIRRSLLLLLLLLLLISPPVFPIWRLSFFHPSPNHWV